uniref:Uncharacterized protein n=1 Tax=Anguilla anguilla TaxID=7936 RepID=A0A0E9SUR6_ANGAN
MCVRVFSCFIGGIENYNFNNFCLVN